MKEYSQCKGAGLMEPMPYTIIYKGCMIHTFRASMLAVCIAFMLTRVVWLCHSVGNRPHQVRFGRVLALSSTQKGKFSAKAHLIRTVSDRMTTHIELMTRPKTTRVVSKKSRRLLCFLALGNLY